MYVALHKNKKILFIKKILFFEAYLSIVAINILTFCIKQFSFQLLFLLMITTFYKHNFFYFYANRNYFWMHYTFITELIAVILSHDMQKESQNSICFSISFISFNKNRLQSLCSGTRCTTPHFKH